MIVNTPAGRKRVGEFGSSAIPTPGNEGLFGSWTVAGRRVTTADAVGLPAVLAGIRFLAETVATFPIEVCRETQDRQKERQTNSDQWRLLNTQPNERQTPFMFKAFMVASMIGHGGFAALKAKARKRVMALYPMDPTSYSVVREGGEIVFKVRDPSQTTGIKTLTRKDVLYIPGVLLDDPEIGISPLRIHANAVATALGTEEYAGKFYANDATPRGVILAPFGADSQQATDAKKAWNEGGQGSSKAHQTRVLFSNATYQQIGVNAQDAQIIDAQRWSVEQAARALRLPNWALGVPEGPSRTTPEQRNMELLQFSIAPWLVRGEEGFHADDDLFPDKIDKPEFLATGILRADSLARAQAHLIERQGGWKSINDIRGEEGLSPIDGGDDYQVTPVGGAPNLQPADQQQGNTEPDQAPANPTT